MFDTKGVKHHPAIEEVTEVLCNRTQNTDKGFFRTEVAYFLAKIASNMRTTVITKDRGEIPVNIYALVLATSGFGKGHSVNIMESEFLKGFKETFMKDTMPLIAEQSLWVVANDRALRAVSDPNDEFAKVEAEYKRAGAFPFTFDSGTPPAVKQLRHKLILANIGSINLQIDEIGSNLIGSTDVLTLFLELYDQGLVKQKLTKNTAENQRSEEVDGKTPTNMLLFGTPAKLLDGGPTEEQFYSMLDTGYARRCLFGYGQHTRKALNSQTPTEIYHNLIKPTNSAIVTKWAQQFAKLADPTMYAQKITMEDDVAIELLTYKNDCEKRADEMADHEEIRKAELSHRYFKVLKLAGAYAFVDESSEIDMQHLYQAILLVEESGESFQTILNREKTYVKLAKYIAAVNTEVTHADLLEALPFYKSGNAARNEMMTLATAWGYKKHIVIKKTFVDGIEFFAGETLKENNINETIIAYGDHFAYGYGCERVPFDQLHVVTQEQGYHWCNHHFKNGHRAEENVLPGFNLLVVDVDGTASLAAVHELFKEYKFMTYTTKRHTEESNRFRLIIPMNYELKLDAEDYKEFMAAVTAWLPFKIDEAANQRARKWESFAGGTYFYNLEGQLLDVLNFIPKTSKNEQYKQAFQKIESFDNLERWFAQKIATGNRNNHLLRYALTLVDNGLNLMEVGTQVQNFNQKLNNPLTVDEINNTIMVSVAKRFHKA